MTDAVTLSREIGTRLRELRVGRGLTAGRIQGISGVSSLAFVEIGKASVGDMDRVANALGTSLTAVLRDVQLRPSSAAVPPHTLDHVGSAILSLPVKGSKIEAAINAAVREALRRCDDNQSAAARLLGMERKAFVRRLKRATAQ